MDVATGREAGGIRTTANPRGRVPAGIRRVGAQRNTLASVDGRDTRVNADVAIIDTGIERDHPDLNVAGGYNCTSRNRAKWDDVDGHGTHVAGIVGALDNHFGVVGVAPGVRLWSVKVLGPRGQRPDVVDHLRHRLGDLTARAGQPRRGRCSRSPT